METSGTRFGGPNRRGRMDPRERTLSLRAQELAATLAVSRDAERHRAARCRYSAFFAWRRHVLTVRALAQNRTEWP